MCGLVGIIEPNDNGFSHQNLTAFKYNLYLNAFRGADSTGVMGVNRKGFAGIIKEVGSAALMMETNPKWDSFEQSLFKEGKLAFGHGRAATRGNITLNNAHPFVVDNGKKGKDRHTIILAHNGTLAQHQTLSDFHEFDVDSAWMAQKIFDLGPDEALSKINGAIAAIWWDSKEKALFVYRNYERPLHFVQTNDTIHINSEASVLMYLKYKLNLQYEWENVFQFQVDTLYKFDIKNPTKFTSTPIKRKWEPITTSWEQHRSRQNSVNQRRLDEIANSTNGNVVRLLGAPLGSFEEEVMQIWQENIERVIFIGGQKIINYKNKASTEEPCEPYEKDLASICKIKVQGKADQLKFSYLSEDAISTFTLISRHEWYGKVKAIGEEKKKDGASSIDAQLMPGKKIHFHTKVQPENKSVIRHQALAENRINPGMAVYNNDVDGSFRIGQQVLMEIYGVNKNKDKHTNYSGDRYEGMLFQLNPSPEIVLYFHTHQWSKEEVFKEEQWVGNIVMIFPQSNAEYKDSGGHIKIYINNAKPASTLTTGERELIVRDRNLSYEDSIEAYYKSQIATMMPRRVTGPTNEE